MKGGAFLAVGLPGKVLEAETARLLARLEPGGVILLPRNIEDAGQLSELTASVRREVPTALLYLDAEGGRVDRLRHVLGPAPGGDVLARNPPCLAQRSGRWVGAGLRYFGFDVNLAPVVDLDHGLAGNALDRRYLGSTPRGVVARARAFLGGLHAAGVGGCLKHFPGLGLAGEDTHDRGTVIAASEEALAPDLEPFRRLAGEAGAVMVNHASYPEIDPSGLPASLSREIVWRLLRRRTGFRGLALSDDLDMHALDPWGSAAERAEASFAAGCDVVFLCQSLDAAVEAARRMARPALAARRAEAAQRLARLRRRLGSLRKKAKVHGPEAVARKLAVLGGT